MGPLKVTTVFRFQSSAVAVGPASTHRTVRHSAIPSPLSSFIISPDSFLRQTRPVVVVQQELFMLSASQEIYSRKVRLVFSEPWKVVRGPVSRIGEPITGQY